MFSGNLYLILPRTNTLNNNLKQFGDVFQQSNNSPAMYSGSNNAMAIGINYNASVSFSDAGQTGDPQQPAGVVGASEAWDTVGTVELFGTAP